MRIVLATLLFVGFFAEAEDLNKKGFFSLNFGVAVDRKFESVRYPVFWYYGGDISKNIYAGEFGVGVGIYGGPFNLSFKYSYDFMSSGSDWGFGFETVFYLGGREVEGEYYLSKGVNLYLGNDLGLFVGRYVSKSLAVLVRGGINNALIHKFRSDKKLTHEFLTPNFYLGTGFQWEF